MLSVELALALRRAGLTWSPAKGDRFLVPDRDLDDVVFVLSDMVIEELRSPAGTTLLVFNGTTEWALDSLEESEALWLPREDQLRELIGDRLLTLERLADPVGYAVSLGGATERYVDVSAEAAYARALLVVLGG